MSERDIEQLSHLHDAVVETITWKHVDGNKVVEIILTCDAECERGDWAGQQVAVIFGDVLLQSSLLLGHVDGKDIFDGCRDGLSPDLSEHVRKLIEMGIRLPTICVRVALHSGSEIQLACGSITVETRPRGAQEVERDRQ